MKGQGKNIVLLLIGVLLGFILNGIITLTILRNQASNLSASLSELDLWADSISGKLYNINVQSEQIGGQMVNIKRAGDDLIWELRKEMNDWSRLK